MRVRMSCGLLALASLLLLAVSVSGAGHNPDAARMPHPLGTPKTFPTRAELEADPDLKAKFTGDNKLIVHVVPHTHDDVGWLKTVDQYFLGANNSIQHAAVHYILDTVTEELAKNPDRKFIYVEQAFFQMWYQRQTPAIQKQVQGQIKSGQLEFINGGWCMHDEANTHFIDMVDQTTLGHQYILSQFGPDALPKVTWQIDPFGHTSTQASLLSAEAGFEALFFGRIDHYDHDLRMLEKNMEFVWRASPSLGESAQVFTGAFQNGNYGPPSGFCWDTSCGDAPMITDQTFIDYNVQERVQSFLDQILYQSLFTKGVNLMITMGSDFQYENAREWYENLDKLLEAVNADGRIQAMYSTPSQYVRAKNAEQLDFTVKTDDFMPYSDGDDSYWTGYFTSRPSLKRYVRTSSALLQAARQLEMFGGGDGSRALPLEQAVGVVQHHDAVAGTAKQHVAWDYAQRLHIAQAAAQQMMGEALANMTLSNQAGSPAVPQFAFCELANISVCAASTNKGQAFQVTLYNGLARARTELVTFPIWGPDVVVTDSTAQAVQAQVMNVLNVSAHTADSAALSLSFLASLPALGFRTYFVSPVARGSTKVFHEAKFLAATNKARTRAQARASTFVCVEHLIDPALNAAAGITDADVTIQNALVSLTVSGVTGQVTSLLDKVSGTATPFNVGYGWYNSYAGQGQKSGAYIFRPQEQRLNRVSVIPRLIVQQGPVVEQVTQLYNEFLNHTLRVVVGGSAAVEVEYTVGEIPIEDGVGKEAVIQYQTNIASASTWYSDSNGREMQPRVRDHRFSWNFTVTQPIAGNYVPMTTSAYITDGKNSLAVLNDRAQGVVSMQDGTLEIMVHRRTLQDDGRGVGEPLNETQWMTSYAATPRAQRSGAGLVITGTHYLFFSNASGSAAQWRPMQQRVYSPFVQAFAPLQGSSIQQYIASHNVEVTWAQQDLPVNVDLVSLQSWAPWSQDPKSNVVMLRLAHMFAVGEDAKLSAPVSVDLAKFFPSPPIDIQPMSLTVTKKANAYNKEQALKWNVEGDNAQENLGELSPSGLKGSVVTLNPMQVQTFLVTFDY